MLMTLVFVVLSAFCAALLRGFTGFGFAIAAVPLLSLGLPPSRVVPLSVLLQILASVIDLRSAARTTDWRSLAWLSPGLVIGTPVGLMLLTQLSAQHARLMFGLLIIGSALLLGRGLRLPPHPARWVVGVVGLLAGLIMVPQQSPDHLWWPF